MTMVMMTLARSSSNMVRVIAAMQMIISCTRLAIDMNVQL